MVIRKIYLDMDGVLADFDSGVRELCGIEPPPQDERWQPGDDPKRFPWYAREDRQAPPFDPAACRLDAAERE